MTINLRDPQTRNLVAIVALVGLGLYAFFGTPWVPYGFPASQQRIAELKAEFEKKSSDLARARQAVADLPRFQAEFAALHERYELAGELLPLEKEFPGLLRKLTLTGQQAGVTFQLVQPQGVIEQGNYTELPIRITVRGGYHQVGQFLAQIANLRRIVNVSNLAIATQPSATDAATCEATFTATAYVLNPDRAAARPAVQGG